MSRFFRDDLVSVCELVWLRPVSDRLAVLAKETWLSKETDKIAKTLITMTDDGERMMIEAVSVHY